MATFTMRMPTDLNDALKAMALIAATQEQYEAKRADSLQALSIFYQS
ncbi:hypothetical protein IPG36_02370 [bacterium]|nr:MAG: hypothetical protein IPG36_02370 [bacterium]